MDRKSFLKKLIHPIIVIGAAVILRLVPHEPNFAPISAMALLGGTYLSRRWALLVPLFAMVASDYLLLYVNPFRIPMADFSNLHSPLVLFHSTTLFVYTSFMISGLIGLWLRHHKALGFILGASLVCSLQFFIITNFGVWAIGSMYPKTIEGLLAAYIAAIPFFRGTLLGDLFYTTLFFGGYELLLKTSRKLTLAVTK